MRNRRALPLLAGALATAQALLLAGCGTGNGGDAAGAGSTGPTSTGTKITGVGAVTPSSTLKALVPASVKRTGLRAVVSAPYAPFETFGTDNRLEGVDVDFAHAIGAKLGLAASVSNVDFSGLIPAMQSHRYDIALAGMADTDERQKVLSFVDYAQTGGSVLVTAKDKGGVATFTDVCGHSVGVEKGTTYDQVVQYNQRLCTAAGKPRVKVVQEATQASALLAIQSGAIDALLTGSIPAALLEKGQPDKVTWVRDPKAPKGYFDNAAGTGTYTGLGVAKDEQALFQAVYQAAHELGEDGTTKKIFAKWGIGANAVVPPLKNTGGR